MKPREFDSSIKKPSKGGTGPVRKSSAAERKHSWHMSTFHQRLREKIGKLRDQKGGYLPLENAIREVLGIPPEHRTLLSRRQLQKIVDGQNIPLRFEQLDMLDRYLRYSSQESLADILNPPSVLRLMAEEGRVAFVMGSQPYSNDKVRKMDIFSRWDIKSMQTIQEGLYATGRPLQILIEDVILRGREAEVFQGDTITQNSEDWFRLVGNLDSPGESLIVLGSPRVNHGAEKVLGAMLGVMPFRPWPLTTMADRPFAFFWPDWWKDQGRPGSCLHFDSASESSVKLEPDDKAYLKEVEARGWDAVQADQERFYSAVIANGVFYPVRRGGEVSTSYAIIAARRGLHRTCACICGATGPATLAAARMFERFIPEFNTEGRDQRVAWCLVKAEVRDEGMSGKESFRADQRIVVDQEIVDNKIHFFPPKRH